MAVAFPRAAYVENRTGILQHVCQNGWLRLGLLQTSQICHVHSVLCAGNETQTSDPLRARNTPQGAADTLISGTTILDSGFLSNMRVIRSFKSSAMSGLGGGDTSRVGDVTKGLEKVATYGT